MNFSDFEVNVFWLMMTAIGGYIGYQMKEMTKSLEGLNIKIAVMLERIETHSEKLQEHAERLRSLEDCKCPFDGVSLEKA